MLRTKIAELFGITYPVMSAPMTNHSGGQLAAAVSKAGGLGTFAGIHGDGPGFVREQAKYIREQTDSPFGVGFITHMLPDWEPNFDAVLEEKVPVVFFSFGDPKPWLIRAKDTGAITVCQVQSLEDAAEAVAAGTDVLVVQGSAAGGHLGHMNLLPFLAHIVDLYPDTPVMASGGIATGRALAAVLAAGAEGANLGTVFLATPENVEVPDAFKEQVVRSDGQDTKLTTLYDVIGGGAWPRDIVGRVYNNRFVRTWDGRDAEIQERLEELSSDAAEAWAKHDTDVASVYMGQSAVSVNSIQQAGDVLQNICTDAERILGERFRELGL
jgi:nitronate monooxygenase